MRIKSKRDRLFETLNLRVSGQMDSISSTIIPDEEEEDLYFVFRAFAAYLGFGHESASKEGPKLGLWAMNYAEFLTDMCASETTAEFQVGIVDNPKLVVTQFLKCAEMSLERFGVFEPRAVELTYSPGRAKDMHRRLFDSMGLLTKYTKTDHVQSQLKLDCCLPAHLSECGFDALTPNWDNCPIIISVHPDSYCSVSDSNAEHCQPSKRSHFTGTVSMPDFSFDCTAWTISFLISSLASIDARDIRVSLDLVEMVSQDSSSNV